jgi:hypothetical protein
MKLLVSAMMVLAIVAPAAFAAQIPACDALIKDKSSSDYVNTGDCYKKNKEWGLCTLYYMKAARTAELAWNKKPPVPSVSLKYYNPEYYQATKLGSDTGICAFNYGDSDLVNKLEDYYDWLQFYVINNQPPAPFDMGAVITALEEKLIPKVEEPTGPTGPTEPTEPTGPEVVEQPKGFDLGSLLPLVGFAVVALIVLAVVIGAAAFFLTRKPAGTKMEKHAAPAAKKKK